MVSKAPPRIVICVATYMRPQPLARLIDALGRQRFVDERPDLSLVVVDNDPVGSAREAVAFMRRTLPFPISYFVEPARGYSQARNRALREAGKENDFIALIDDDEVPGDTWLQHLLATQRRFGAGMVAGPVDPVLPAHAPRWIIRGGFFQRPHRATGARLETAGAGNLLIARNVFEDVPSFDVGFGASGGEDTDFTVRARRAGHEIVWCEEAGVIETVEADRLHVGWLCSRSFSGGRNFYRVQLGFSPTVAARSRVFGRAVGRAAEGLALVTISPFMGFHLTVKGMRSITRAAGLLSAVTQSRAHA